MMREQDYRTQFQIRFNYSDEDMPSLDARILIDECWGNPMSYQRLLEIANTHGEPWMLNVVYHSGRVYYGDLDKPPHPLNQSIDPHHAEYQKHGKGWGERRTYIIALASALTSNKIPPFPQCKTHTAEEKKLIGKQEVTRINTFYTLDLWDVQLKPFFDICYKKYPGKYHGGVIFKPVGTWDDTYPVLVIYDDYVE